MKILRTLLVASLIAAAFLAFRAQRQGSGALAAQLAFLTALVLLAADRVAAVRAEKVANGRAVLQVGLGLLVGALLFSPDFLPPTVDSDGRLSLDKVIAMAMDKDDDTRALALETCIRRRARKACRPAFERALLSDNPQLKALGQQGLRGRRGR